MPVQVFGVDQADLPCIVKLPDGVIVYPGGKAFLSGKDFRYECNSQLAGAQSKSRFYITANQADVRMKSSSFAHFAAHTSQNVVFGEHGRFCSEISLSFRLS